jgi:hypothetical protein
VTGFRRFWHVRVRGRLDLTEPQRDQLLKQLVHAPCVHCAGAHERACPRPRRIVFGPDGRQISEVEFWPERKWSPWPRRWPLAAGPRNGVVFLSDIFEDGMTVPELSDEERELARFGGNPVMAMLSQFTRQQALRQAIERAQR